MPFPQILLLSSESIAQCCPSNPYEELQATVTPALSFLYIEQNKPRDISCSSNILPFRPYIIFVGPFGCSLITMSFLYCDIYACTLCSRRGHAEQIGQPLPLPGGSTGPHVPPGMVGWPFGLINWLIFTSLSNRAPTSLSTVLLSCLSSPSLNT